MIQRQADKVAICIMTIIIVLAGCAASGDKKVELPESVSIESIECSSWMIPALLPGQSA